MIEIILLRKMRVGRVKFHTNIFLPKLDRSCIGKGGRGPTKYKVVY